MKKFFKSIFLSLGLLSMAAGGALTALKAKPTRANEVKADGEYTIINTEVTRVRMVYGWLTFDFTTFASGETQISKAKAFTDFNTLTNIYLNGDQTIKAFDTTTTVMGYHMDGANQFWSAMNPSYPYFKGISTLTIPSGTEFASLGTAEGTEKVKYVTTSDVTFYNLSYAGELNTEMTHENNVNFVNTDVEMFSNGNPNPTWPGFKLTANDFASKGNASVISNVGIYNFLEANNRVTNTARDGKTHSFFDGVTIAYTNFNAACADYVSFAMNGTHPEWTDQFLSYKIINIPAGTVFPSHNWQDNIANPAAQKTLYRTTKDIIFYCSNQYGTAYTKVEPTFVDNNIWKIGGNLSFIQGELPYTNLTIDLEFSNRVKTGANLAGNWALAGLFSGAEFYNGDTPITAAVGGVVNYSYGAMFCDFNGACDYLIQVQTDGLNAATKVVFKKGTIFPSPAFLAGTSNVWYRLPDDQTLLNVSNNWGSCKLIERFINDYMHPEIGFDAVGTGKCVSEGWYGPAKIALQVLGSANIVVLANTPAYAPYWARINAWATANGEAFNYSLFVFEQNRSISTIPSVSNNNSSTIILIVVGITSLGLLGLVIQKKKKFT